MSWTPARHHTTKLQEEEPPLLYPQPDQIFAPKREVAPLTSTPPVLTRVVSFLLKQWTQLSTQAKVDSALVTAGIGLALATSVCFSTFCVFGLTLIARALFYAFYSWRVEIGRFEAKVAARSLAFINVLAFIAVTVALVQSNAIWRYWAYWFLVLSFAMEIDGIRSWWTKWAQGDIEKNRRGGLRLLITHRPHSGYIATALVWILLENIAFGILWLPLLDETILWTFHAIVVVVVILYKIVVILVKILILLIKLVGAIINALSKL